MSRRRTTTLLVAVVLLCLSLGACGGSESSDSASSDSAPRGGATSTSDAPTASVEVLELTVDPTTQPKCMVPSAEVLATQDTAFEGTVTEVSDATATLSVETWYAGDAGTDTVSVSTPSEQLQDLLVAVEFREGRTYLVSSLDGRVSLCGFTAESTPELEELYSAAFAG